MSENDLLVVATNYKTFFAIAVSSQVRIHELVRERNEAEKTGPRSDRDIDAMCENDAAIRRHGMIAVVFSAMTLESYINHYGIKYSSKSFFGSYIDHMNLEGKWLILPRIVTRSMINTDSRAFGLFCKLIKLRNRLVTTRQQLGDSPRIPIGSRTRTPTLP